MESTTAGRHGWAAAYRRRASAALLPQFDIVTGGALSGASWVTGTATVMSASPRGTPV